MSHSPETSHDPAVPPQDPAVLPHGSAVPPNEDAASGSGSEKAPMPGREPWTREDTKSLGCFAAGVVGAVGVVFLLWILLMVIAMSG